MDKISTLRRYGLFDAKVPRYTSYPPANRFEQGVGAKHQRAWLTQLSRDAPVSVYIHIPFCRRLCWFCACRTQGTKTLSPVEGYVEDLIAEINMVSTLPRQRVRMARLHLGGGTPTLLSTDLMDRLLTAVFDAFDLAASFEFSVEIDPTEAAPELLALLARWGMQRASIGVQDFNPNVQKSIGRMQSFEQTQAVCDILREHGVQSLNVDFLYGLPHQTPQSLSETLDKVVLLKPDRLALYGYAHVPHVSKRQTMIPAEHLPESETRFEMSELARDRLCALGFTPLGIDHFALPDDSLAHAALHGKMRRNFQGYTDDPCETLIGIGASAISRFRDGYCQNAVSTSAYRQRIQATGLAGHKGYELHEEDRLLAGFVEQIMCTHRIDLSTFDDGTKQTAAYHQALINDILLEFLEIVTPTDSGFAIRQGYEAAARLICAHLDATLTTKHGHSLAI